MLGCRTMRMIWSSRFCLGGQLRLCILACVAQTHLEALILQHTLDGRIFTTGRQLRLEDYAERAVADNLALRVCEVFVVAGQAVLDLFADNFCGIVSMTSITPWVQGGD
ncbi:Pkinase-domain-containing protein [Alternaria alternata]|nr:Pkinase-domain-containing protein [Alternaria alternata]